MVEYTTKIIDSGALAYKRSNALSLLKPEDTSALDALYAEAQKKTGGCVTWRASLPHRTRTTGWKSQNHHLRGHVRQLCGYTGFSMSEMMQVVKEEVPSWPVEYKEFRGKKRTVHASEADVSIEVCSEAIEVTHHIAADLGVRLIEGKA